MIHKCLPFCTCRHCRPDLYGPTVNITKTSFKVMIRTVFCVPDVQARTIVNKFWHLLDTTGGLNAMILFAENVKNGTTKFDNDRGEFYTMTKIYL